MANEIAAPINTQISITPLTTPPASRDASGIPAQLQGVAPGTTVEGFVINRDPQNNPILRTVLGDVSVKSDVFIKTGSEVVFRIDTTQQGSARILTIDGVPPQDYANANARGISADTINATQMPSATQAAQQPGLGGKAIAVPIAGLLVSTTTPLTPAAIAANPLLASVAAGTTPVIPGLMKLQQGAQLQLRLLQVELPLPGDAEKAPSQATGTTAPPPRPDGQQTATQGMANAQTAKIALQQAGMQESPKSLAELITQPTVDPLPRPPAPSLAAMKAQQAVSQLPLPGSATMAKTTPQPGVPAYVLGHEGDGATILQTPMGTVKTYLPQPLPTGTAVRVQVEVPPRATTLLPGTPLPEENSSVTSLAQAWPALDDALKLLPATNEGARPLLQAVPEVGPKLVSGLLFFMAALKTGDLKQWIGPKALAALESRAPDLVARLKGDMAQLQGLLIESPLQQWNSAMVPLLYQGQLEHARLFFRDDSEAGGDDKKKKGGGDQRFIVEVDTSHLGEVQFDGFVRHGGPAKQFDLMVRSSGPLPAELQAQVRGTFETAMETSGMKGYLGFQPGSQHFVRPMASGPKPSGGTQPILA